MYGATERNNQQPNPLTHALLGGTSPTSSTRPSSPADTHFSSRSEGTSPTHYQHHHQNYHNNPSSSSAPSGYQRPMPPLAEDSDDEFLMGLGAGPTSGSQVAGVGGGGTSGRSISSSSNNNNNSRRSAIVAGEDESSRGFIGANGNTVSPSSGAQQRSPSALDEFEELMAMGEAQTATPTLSPAGFKNGGGGGGPSSTTKQGMANSNSSTTNKNTPSNSSDVIGNLRAAPPKTDKIAAIIVHEADDKALGSSSSEYAGSGAFHYSSSSSVSDETEEGTESDFDDTNTDTDGVSNGSSNSLGRWQNGGRERGNNNNQRGGAAALSNESMLLKFEMTSGRNSPRMGSVVSGVGGGAAEMLGGDEEEARRMEILFGGSMGGSGGGLGSFAAKGNGKTNASSSLSKQRDGSKGKSPRRLASSLSHFSFSGAGGLHQQKPKRLKPMRISKYLLGVVMGNGVTCTVRDAIDISNNNLARVAVKLLKRPEKKLSRLNARDRAHIEGMIDNELEMLQRFHHPNVMRALDVFTRNAKEYVAMPIAVCSLQDFINIRAAEMRRRALEGCDSAFVSRTQSLNPNYQSATPLAVLGGYDFALGSRQQTSNSAFGGDDRFTSKVLAPAKLVKDIFLQVLAGVAYLHSQNVHHNDLKPSNILMFGDGSIRVSDLGCSGPNFEVGRHGTPAFVSPQVVSHLIGHENPGLVSASEPVDPSKNDAWACGVVLYQLLTGRLPFGNTDDEDDTEGVGGDDGGEECYAGQLTEKRGAGGHHLGSADDLGLDDHYNGSGRGGSKNLNNNRISREGGRGAEGGKPLQRPLYRRQVNEFTIYKDIVHLPVDYDRVFEEGDGGYEALRSPGGSVTNVPIPPPQALRGMGKGASSGKHLLMGLLNKNQKERLSVQAALQHPWLQDAVQRAPPVVGDYMPPIPNIDPTSQSPKAPGLAPQGSTAHNTSLKRLFDVAEIREMIEKDFRRHMQHVAEVCFIIRLELPLELYREPCDASTKPPLMLPARPFTPPSPNSCLFKCVNGSRFIADSAMRHYAQKGKADCDIVTLRNQPQRRVHFLLYVEGLIHLCEELANKTTFATNATNDKQAATNSNNRSMSEAAGKPEGNVSTNKNSEKKKADEKDKNKEGKVKSSCWCC